MSYYPIAKWKLITFEISINPHKMYEAVIQNRVTGIHKRIPFGNVRKKYYTDKTGLDAYDESIHRNSMLKELYQKRNKRYLKSGYYSSGYFTWWYLND